MITYLKGDATYPEFSGMKLLPHVCNDSGKWGRGYVLALSKRWDRPERFYRMWHQDFLQSELRSVAPGKEILTPLTFGLGEVQFVQVEDDIYVANMVAQVGYGMRNGIPLRYSALEQCLDKVAVFAKALNASVSMPRIGAGLAGGDWTRIEPIISKSLNSVNTYIYDLISA